MESLVVAFDRQNVRVPGDRPERPEQVRLDDLERRLPPQPAKCVVDAAAVGVGGWIDDGIGNCQRHLHGFISLFWPAQLATFRR